MSAAGCRRERVDDLDVSKSAKPRVLAIDPPHTMLSHQSHKVRVRDVVATRLIAAGGSEQIPESIHLAQRADVSPLQ